jgi:hypothetical protein
MRRMAAALVCCSMLTTQLHAQARGPRSGDMRATSEALQSALAKGRQYCSRARRQRGNSVPRRDAMLRCSCRSLWRSSARPVPRHASTEAGGVAPPGAEAPVAAGHSGGDGPAADTRPPYVRPTTCASSPNTLPCPTTPAYGLCRCCKQLSAARVFSSSPKSLRLCPASHASASAPPSSVSPGEVTTATGRCSVSDPAWCAVVALWSLACFHIRERTLCPFRLLTSTSTLSPTGWHPWSGVGHQGVGRGAGQAGGDQGHSERAVEAPHAAAGRGAGC